MVRVALDQHAMVCIVSCQWFPTGSHVHAAWYDATSLPAWFAKESSQVPDESRRSACVIVAATIAIAAVVADIVFVIVHVLQWRIVRCVGQICGIFWWAVVIIFLFVIIIRTRFRIVGFLAGIIVIIFNIVVAVFVLAPVVGGFVCNALTYGWVGAVTIGIVDHFTDNHYGTEKKGNV